ncbi:ribonuclease R [Papillibacter cinnamivorans]|uniref:Ribonuclease R n=1 Tax=Papillibacter cinnamivorans DSM 12816 TaxID=1122930 RepID=A0A1W2CRW6_9FIRM|nr:ribonuclease R [Papillibacter cinnamivorans]SMC87642.1 ribonuclease R [Papillibacter cinnamivorans DSM 12816]
MKELKEAILALFQSRPGTVMTLTEVSSKLNPGPLRSEVGEALRQLEEEGLLMTSRRGKYLLPASLGYVTGRFQSTGRGFGFVTPEDGGADFFIPPGATKGAWHGDKVLILPESGPATGGRRAAAVEKILSRENKVVTGRLVRNRRHAHLEPDNRRLPSSIEVTAARSRGGKDGDKVAVSLFSYGRMGRHEGQGTVRAVFGRDGTREAAAAAILYIQGIDPVFPASVLAAARSVPKEVPDPLPAGRLDLRGKIIFTIDGADAKDLDDAVSLEKSPEGNYILGVHIADVSHYVTQDSPLDLEALRRGTSVYFADKVIPMLPTELSNGICSLNPKVPRLTMTVFMTLSPDGAILEHSIHKSVICTTERMTYENCNLLLADADPALAQRYENILPTLRVMAELAAILEKKRALRGALRIQSSESKIICNESGEPMEITFRPRGVSEQLIEEFMLAANETVAEHMNRLNKPTVYRVHEKPSPAKVEAFSAVISALGYTLSGTSSTAMQAVLDAAAGKPEEPLVNSLLLHSMMKARYSPSNLGHFGLAAEFYCHFTSPIRRYPDLAVHRLLKLLLDGKLEGRVQEQSARFAALASEVSSEREVAAETAERDIEKLYKAEYMRGHIGEVFQGVVSGVQRFGVFVTLPNSVEGMIPTEALPGEYEYSEAHMTLTGGVPRRKFSFGLSLRVQCVASDAASGRIDFRLEE